MPQECKQLGTSEGDNKFKNAQLGTPNKIKNAANKDCKYWLVHNRLGCVLNTRRPERAPPHRQKGQTGIQLPELQTRTLVNLAPPSRRCRGHVDCFIL
jgi:hypothetical protein